MLNMYVISDNNLLCLHIFYKILLFLNFCAVKLVTFIYVLCYNVQNRGLFPEIQGDCLRINFSV